MAFLVTPDIIGLKSYYSVIDFVFLLKKTVIKWNKKFIQKIKEKEKKKKNAKKKTTKRCLKTTEVLLDADWHMLN